MSDARAEALLRSALEKIVYFEARSGQLEGDVAAARAEVDRLKTELGSSSARELELKQHLAELEVHLARTHRDREELGRVVEALRLERATQVDKLLDAARIRGVLSGEDGSFDLAAFISQLRSEALVARGVPVEPPAPPEAAIEVAIDEALPLPWEPAAAQEPVDDAVAFQAEVARQMARGVWDESAEAAPPVPAPVAAAPVLESSRIESQRRAVLPLDTEGPFPRSWAPGPDRRAPPPESVARESVAPSRPPGAVELAEGLRAQGRLGAARPTPGMPPRRRVPGDETLFGFSVRELSAPDPGARIRAAERLATLGDRAAAPAVAAALHGERDPRVAVALLGAFRALAGREGAAVVEPFAEAPSADVRIAALRALVALDAGRAVLRLQQAGQDSDPAVRRRATLLGLQLPPEHALALDRQQRADADPEVRRVSALAAGATGGQEARSTLLAALDDPAQAVRQAAARSLSRLLGVEVDTVAGLEGPQRRREIRRLTSLPVAPVSVRARSALSRAGGLDRARALAGSAQVEVLEAVEAVPAPVAPRLEGEALCGAVLGELKGAMRGRSLGELAMVLDAPPDAVESVCVLLSARGQVVRRGTKIFVA